MPGEINGQLLEIDNIVSIAPGAGADGWDVTSGTTGDAAYTGTGAGSKIAILKAILAKGGGGAVTEADGANVTLGAKADAAYAGSGSSSAIAALKGLYAVLTGQISIKAVAASFVAGSFADGAITALGATTDAPLAAAASGAGASQASVLKGLFNLFFGGTAKVQAVQWWKEASNSNVAASTALNGTARANPAGAAGAPGPFGYFHCAGATTVSGTAYVQDDGGVNIGQLAVPANSTFDLKVPAVGATLTAIFITGGTGGSVSLRSVYTTA